MRPSRTTRLSLLLFLFFLSPIYAADSLTLSDLIKMPGKLVAKGSNLTAVGQFGLKSYRVEELMLSPAVVTIDGETIKAAKAWRVTITGNQIPVRSVAATITLDGVDLRAAIEKDDLSEITSFTFDPSLIHNGATLSVSYGVDDPTVLPETLTLR